jgi:hypothetical protein
VSIRLLHRRRRYIHSHCLCCPGDFGEHTSRSSSAYSWFHARTLQMSVPPSPAVSLLSLCAIPLVAYSAQIGRSSFEAPVTTIPQYNLLSSASTFLATVSFGSMWFSRLPTTAEILMGILLSYGPSPSLWCGGSGFDPFQVHTQRSYRLPMAFRMLRQRESPVPI